MLIGLTIFLSAFLLFQVQLIVAKHLLPWFGGAPAVWTTCQMFFQLVLLAGYTYAHLLAGIHSLRRQAWIHLMLVAATLAVLGVFAVWSEVPLLAPDRLRPTGAEQPAAWLLLVLVVSVGLPFLLLSATGPLLQRWHSHTTDSLHRTYRLYALSNAGSLLGLLTYPIGFERWLDVPGQALTWTALFLVFSCACAGVARRVTRLTSAAPSRGQDDQRASGPTPDSLCPIREPRRPWLWFLLSFSSSAMFLSTTNQLALEVAAVPFLWIMPLGIYLVTFIICFDRPRWYARNLFWTLTTLAAIGILPVSVFSSSLFIPHQILAYSLFLGLFCMVCHGELSRMRPGAARLTQFYLLIAVGGASGGAFVSLVAPALFSDVWEFNLTVLLGLTVFALLGISDRTSPLHLGNRALFVLVAVLVCIVGTHLLILGANLSRASWVAQYDWVVPVAGGGALGLVASLVLWRTRLPSLAIWPRFVILCAGLIAGMTLVHRMRWFDVESVYSSRDFYGVVRIQAVQVPPFGTRIRMLLDGNTVHGVQVMEKDLSKTPTAYYAPSSGIALISSHLARGRGSVEGGAVKNLHLGVLGMGAGTMAAFAQPGDRIRFYELNPTVIDIAMGLNAQFTFIADGAGEVFVVAGDGRLSLERELKEGRSQKFDLLAMDAFSSDAVPVHLLTEEAFGVYAAHLRDEDSILAVNVTNRHLDLEPVVATSARRWGFHGIRVDSEGDPPVSKKSTWLLLSRNPDAFEHTGISKARSRPLRAQEIAFTDRYSNLFRVLK